MTSRAKVKIEIDPETFQVLASVPSSIFEQALKADMFIFSWRIGYKDLDLGVRYAPRTPNFPYTFPQLQQHVRASEVTFRQQQELFC